MGRGVYCLVNPPLGRHLGRPQRVNFERERGELPWRGGRTEIGGPSLITVGLRADFRIAHCAPISLGPTRYHPRVFSRPPFSFTVTTGLPPSGKKSRTRHTLGSAFDPRSGRPNGKLLNGKVGELPGGTVEQKLGAPL